MGQWFFPQSMLVDAGWQLLEILLKLCNGLFEVAACTGAPFLSSCFKGKDSVHLFATRTGCASYKAFVFNLSGHDCLQHAAASAYIKAATLHRASVIANNPAMPEQCINAGFATPEIFEQYRRIFTAASRKDMAVKLFARVFIKNTALLK